MKEFFKEHIDELIEKYTKGSISYDESADLLKWTKQDNNKKYFREQLFLFKSIKQDADFDENLGFNDLLGRVYTQKRKIYSYRYAAAAILILLLSSAAILIFNFQTKEVFVDYIAHNDNLEIVLNDSSQVCIRSGSQLSVSNKFNNDNCIVDLKGQAFFKVKKKVDCQFIVKTGLISTKVIGTAFDLKYDTISGVVRVSLEEGLIELYSDDSLIKKVYPNEQIELRQNGEILRFRKLQNLNYKSYKTHLLVFDQSPMNEVVIDLSDYYKMPFLIANKEIEKCRLTSRLDDANLEELRFILEKALNTNIIALDDKIVIHGEGCNK